MSGRKYGKIPQIHRQTNKTKMKFVFPPKFAYSFEQSGFGWVGDGCGGVVHVIYISW